MAKNLIGRFFFKLTDNKNLIGESSNSGDRRIYAESADRIPDGTDDGSFSGKYNHTFCHYYENGKVEGVVAKLTIWRKPDCQNIFSLKIEVQNNMPPAERTFWGEGMLCDGMLIGDYRNFKDIPTSS
jgi:hypothetical protein